MNTTIRALLPLTVLAAFVATGFAPDPQFEEPPLRFELRVGGQEVVVRDGEPVVLTLDGKEHRAVVRALPTRLLQVEGVQFAYPTNMGFEYQEIEDGVHLWTLDGNNVVLMLFSYPESLAGDDVGGDYLDGLGTMFDLEDMGEIVLELGGRKVRGKAVKIAVAMSELEVEVFTLVRGDRVFLLAIQDSLTDEEFEHSDEWHELRALLTRTFRLDD